MAMLREPDGVLTNGVAPAAPPITTNDASLCIVCGERPRLGALARCKQCLQETADTARRTRAEAEATVKARDQAATKRCTICKVEKPLSEFGPHHRSRDGKRKACRPCVRAGRALCKPLKPEQAEVQKLAASKPARRAKNKQAVAAWARRNPIAARARQILMRARRRGEVMPPATCQIAKCEATSLVAHHADYGRPLDVLHICRRHHRLLHGGVALKLKPGVPARLRRLPPVGLEAAARCKTALRASDRMSINRYRQPCRHALQAQGCCCVPNSIRT
jgi:hypothetical protein